MSEASEKNSVVLIHFISARWKIKFTGLSILPDNTSFLTSISGKTYLFFLTSKYIFVQGDQYVKHLRANISIIECKVQNQTLVETWLKR